MHVSRLAHEISIHRKKTQTPHQKSRAFGAREHHCTLVLEAVSVTGWRARRSLAPSSQKDVIYNP